MKIVSEIHFSFEDQLKLALPALHRAATWTTRDPERAADLVQDTVVLALRFRESFSSDTNMKAWLTRIMKNRYISLLRRQSLENRILAAEADFAISMWSMGESGRRAAEHSDAANRDPGFSDTVLHAVTELKQEYRQVVMLCDVDGMSYAEAAAALTCPLGTVMSRLHRGRRILQKRLGSRKELFEAA